MFKKFGQGTDKRAAKIIAATGQDVNKAPVVSKTSRPATRFYPKNS